MIHALSVSIIDLPLLSPSLNKPKMLVTDGRARAIHDMGFFRWVLATHTGCQLATHSGFVQGIPMDSFCAETATSLSAIYFLHILTIWLHITPTNIIYTCNSQFLLDCLMSIDTHLLLDIFKSTGPPLCCHQVQTNLSIIHELQICEGPPRLCQTPA